MLRPSHLPACARLYATVFNRAPWNGRWTPKTARKHILESIGDTTFKGMIAVEGDTVVGFAYGSVSQWENERRFFLKEMCVDGKRQGRGIGTRLLTNLIARLKTQKVRRISLGTGRNTPARKFYLRLGFAVDSQAIIMNKRL